MAAKTPFESAILFAQSALSATPVIILGSGASAAHDVPGMGPLAKHLASLTLPIDWTIEEVKEWNVFLANLGKGQDLETALGAVRPTRRQNEFVADETRTFLFPSDRKALVSLLSDRRHLPLARLYKHLFTSTHKTLHVVTPNYDRLAEYAADAVELAVFTGFNHGHLQLRVKDVDARLMGNGQRVRTVCVWKVHGSLDWFHDADDRIVAMPQMELTPAGFAPLMITPGVEKYRLAHSEPFRTIFTCSDAALEGARSYLCVGYGFNDEHLQTKLVERCDTDSVPLMVVTHGLTPTAKAFLKGGKCRRYLAIEAASTGSRFYTHEHPDGFDVPDWEAWKLAEFLDMTIGEQA